MNVITNMLSTMQQQLLSIMLLTKFCFLTNRNFPLFPGNQFCFTETIPPSGDIIVLPTLPPYSKSSLF
jgi:hypothetical protein